MKHYLNKTQKHQTFKGRPSLFAVLMLFIFSFFFLENAGTFSQTLNIRNRVDLDTFAFNVSNGNTYAG